MQAEWEDADAADGEEQTAGKGEAGPGRRSSSAERTGSQAGRTGSSAARTPSRAERTTSSASSHSRQTHEHRAEAAAAKGQQQHATNAAVGGADLLPVHLHLLGSARPLSVLLVLGVDLRARLAARSRRGLSRRLQRR
eukprot:1804140-Rhodomonas_salina.3